MRRRSVVWDVEGRISGNRRPNHFVELNVSIPPLIFAKAALNGMPAIAGGTPSRFVAFGNRLASDPGQLNPARVNERQNRFANMRRQ